MSFDDFVAKVPQGLVRLSLRHATHGMLCDNCGSESWTAQGNELPAACAECGTAFPVRAGQRAGTITDIDHETRTVTFGGAE